MSKHQKSFDDLVENAPGYQHLHNLVGSLKNLVDSDVSQELLNGIILQVTVTTMHLKGLVYNLTMSSRLKDTIF